jgi:hypothetical protein
VRAVYRSAARVDGRRVKCARRPWFTEDSSPKSRSLLGAEERAARDEWQRKSPCPTTPIFGNVGD